MSPYILVLREVLYMESLVKNDLSRLDQEIGNVSSDLSSLVDNKIKKIPSANAKEFLVGYRSYEKSLINLRIYMLYVDFILKMFKKVYEHANKNSLKNDNILCMIMKKVSPSDYKSLQSIFSEAKKKFVNKLKAYLKNIKNAKTASDFLKSTTKLMKEVEEANTVNHNCFQENHLSVMSIWNKQTISKNDTTKLELKMSSFVEFSHNQINMISNRTQELKSKLSELLDELNNLISEIEN